MTTRKSLQSLVSALPAVCVFTGVLIVDFSLIFRLNRNIQELNRVPFSVPVWYLKALAVGSALIIGGLILQYLLNHKVLPIFNRLFDIPTTPTKLAQFSVPPADRIFYYGIFSIILLSFFIGKMLIFDEDRERIFNDTNSYVSVADKSIADSEFWSGERPFTLPLLYKILGVNSQNFRIRSEMVRVGKFQAIFSVICWIALGLGLACSVAFRWLKPIAFAIILAISLGLDISIWDRMLLSESISFSLFALLLAAGFFAIMAWQKALKTPAIIRALLLILLIGVAALYSFARDSNSYLILTIAMLMVFGLFIRSIRKHPGLASYILVMLSFFAIFLVQSISSNSGKRWQAPFEHVLIERLLPDEDARNFFEKRGMPISDQLLSLENFDSQPSAEFVSFQNWVENNGRTSYMIYLLTHPKESLFLPMSQFTRFVNTDSTEYRNNISEYPSWSMALNRILFPKPGGYIAIAIFLMLLTFLFLTRNFAQIPAWPIIFVLVVSVIPLIFVIWNADTIELERHAAQIGVQIRLAFWMALILLGDILYLKFFKCYPLRSFIF